MRTYTARLLGNALLIAAAIGVAQQRKQQEIDLQAAIRKEAVEGDLNGAIKQYAAIVSKYKADRGTTAMALVHMADCYRKMGAAESRKLYEQVVKDYADQKQAVALARAGLGGGTQGRRQTTTLVWDGPQVDTEGTISPDGRYLSFTDWVNGELAVREISTGENRRITRGEGPKYKDFPEESAISRDGKQVAFSWFDDKAGRYELRIAGILRDAPPRRLYDDPANNWLAPRDWSPDGKSIAVLISRNDGTDRLGLVSTVDGSLRVLRSGTWPGDTRIFFSPDGKHLGYDLPDGDASQPRDLFTYDLTADREIPVARRHGQDIMMGWTPDGSRLLFASDRSGAISLWAQPFRDGKPQGAPELLRSDLGAVEPLGVTQSGAFYYGSVNRGGSQSVHLASFDYATGRISSSRELTSSYPESNSQPTLSPDGKFIAYTSLRGSGNHAVSVIVIRSSDGNQVVREVPAGIFNLNGWTPDGQSLLGVGWLNGKSGVLRMNVQTGKIDLLAENQADEGRAQLAVASIDGKSLYLTRRFPESREFAFFRRDLESGAEKELIRRPFLGGLRMSPDGKHIATPSVDVSSNSRVVLLMNSDGSGLREVMRTASGSDPAQLTTFAQGRVLWILGWAPDSSSFLIRSVARDGSVNELWQAPVGSGSPRKLEGTIDPKILGTTLDGAVRQIAFVLGDAAPRARQIWVLENFLPASK